MFVQHSFTSYKFKTIRREKPNMSNVYVSFNIIVIVYNTHTYPLLYLLININMTYTYMIYCLTIDKVG